MFVAYSNLPRIIKKYVWSMLDLVDTVWHQYLITLCYAFLAPSSFFLWLP